MDDIRPFLFWTTGVLTCLCAVATVVSQNIVRAATYLLFSLAGVAVLFFLLHADLVGAVQVLVYVGGTLVLVVFAVMLTAQGPFITMRASAAEFAISGVVGLLLLGVLGVTAFQVGDPKAHVPAHVKEFAPKAPLSNDPKTAPYTDLIGQGFLGIGVGPARHDAVTGRPARAHYFLPFIIVSVHLLVVLIGAAYLARAKRRQRAAREAVV